MSRKQLLRVLAILLTIALNFLSTFGSPQVDDKAIDKDDPGHTFSYEFLSPQKIVTGCSGTQFASGDVQRVYFFVDATGQKKFIFPNKSAEVVFPSPVGLPGLVRTQRVYMSEMCFPSPCKVQGFCSLGSTVGPTGWSFPRFPSWLPWNNKDKDNSYQFNLNAHGSANADLSTNSANLAVGLSGNVEASQDKSTIKAPVPGSSSSTAPHPPVNTGYELAASNDKVEAALQTQALTQVVDSHLPSHPPGGYIPPPPPPSTEAPATTTVGWGWSTEAPEPSTTSGWGWSTEAPEPSTTSGWGWSTEAPEPSTTSGWGWSTEAPEPSTTSGCAPEPTECSCCDQCPVSKFLEKLAIAGLGNNVPMAQWSSGTWNTYSAPNPSLWSAPRNTEKMKTKSDDMRIPSPDYFANLPGSISGQVPVIYYESCDLNAYYQPAIINYCSSSGPGYGSNNFKGSLIPVVEKAEKVEDIKPNVS